MISWNVNGVYARYPFIQMLLHDYNPIILCLQETKLPTHRTLFLKNFSILRKDFISTGNARGGVLLAVHNTVHFEQIPLTTNLQAVAARVYFDTPITICCIYLHQTDDVTSHNLQQLILQLPQPFIITGDFNAHNTIWGSNTTDQRGRIVESFLSNSNVLLMNTGLPTRFNSYNGTSTAIDLSLSSPNLNTSLQWTVCPSLYTSDHHPQIIEMYSTASCPQTLPRKWHFPEANWELYRSQIDLSAVYSNQHIDRTLNIIVAEIENAALTAVPHTQTTLINGHFRHRVYWWNQNCKQLITEKHKLYNKCRRHPTAENLALFKLARAKVKRAVFQSKRETSRKFISSINSNTPSTVLWNKLRAINNKRNFTPIPVILDTDNQLQTTPEAIAETFAQHYYTVTKSDSTCNAQWRSLLTSPEEANSDGINAPIIINEVKNAVNSLKNTSPGPDGIRAILLKKLSHSHLAAITFFFNRIWQEHCFPAAWREAYILPIRKPNKEATKPANYRPISLTNVLCKTIEKILVKRLHTHLQDRLDPYQCGFRQAMSTTDNLLYLQEEIHLGFSRNRHTTCIFFDVEKAFDRLSPATILESMQQHGLKGNISYFVLNFLHQRSFRVRIGQTYSLPQMQETGTPQGSVLSPFLFILALNSIKEVIHSPIQHLCYADDLAIFLQHNDITSAQKRLQDTINRITDWGAVRGLRFSPSKTKVLNFSRKRSQINFHLTLYEEQLEQVDEATFLGLQFDRKLNWKSHIKQLKQKCFLRLNLLKTLNGSTWGSDRKCLLRLYKCYVRSILDYGCIIYSTASTRTLNQLNTVQHAAIRIAIGALRSSPATSLHVESNTLPLLHHRNLATLLYYFRIHSTPQHINAYRITSKATIFSNFRNHCQQLLQKYNLTALDGQPHIIKSDILPAIQNHWQQEWTQCTTRLHLLKPSIEDWATSYHTERKKEKLLARVRIGHTISTHNYLYERQLPPLCETCQANLDLSHILNICPQYSSLRIKHYQNSQHPILETLINDYTAVNTFFKYICECDLMHKL